MRTLFIITGILIVYTGRLTAQEDNVPTSEDSSAVYEGLFNSENPLHLTLKADLKTFKKTAKKENYHPAEMTCTVNENLQITDPVRIKARGVARKVVCSLPPFWLNIRHSGMKADSLKDLNINRLKMVIRCRSSKSYEHYILREYLVYKLYNLITPYSFRVRLVRLTFEDTAKDNETTEDWAFLIEPMDLMCARLNATNIKSQKLSMRTLNPELMDLVSLFSYMIGNGDFSVTGRHNLKILAVKPPGPQGFTPVAYDFDVTGLVNIPYANPREELGISSLKERYYLGPCRSESVHLESVLQLASSKDELIDCIKEFEYLVEKERMDMVEYIESYFSEAENDNFIERKILSTCH